MAILSDKEIRNKLLESDDPADWKASIGEKMRDELTDPEAAELAYKYYSGSNMDAYFREIMGPHIEETMARAIERYKDANYITLGRDDCSAYKEDRDLNPEKYR